MGELAIDIFSVTCLSATGVSLLGAERLDCAHLYRKVSNQPSTSWFQPDSGTPAKRSIFEAAEKTKTGRFSSRLREILSGPMNLSPNWNLISNQKWEN